MAFLALEPEVAGGFGPHTVYDQTTTPWRLDHLHYLVRGWLGDDLLESSPAFLISPELADQLAAQGCTGFELADAEVTLADDAPPFPEGIERVIGFVWFQPTGTPGEDDVATDAGLLVVSDRTWQLLQQHGQVQHCDVEPWSPST